MLAMAAERAAAECVENLELIVADAARIGALPEATYDAAFIRWGLMYMDAPVAALKVVRHALRRDAPVVLSVWCEPKRVPYYDLPRQLLKRYCPVPAVDFEVPGTFRYADPSRLRADLELPTSSCCSRRRWTYSSWRRRTALSSLPGLELSG